MTNHLDEPLDQWTFALEANGDIRWNRDRHQPYTIDGIPQVKQDLLVALDTYHGEDPLDDEFGLDVFSAVRHTDNLKHEVTRTIEYDDYRHNRVQTVLNVEVERRPPGSRTALVKILARLDDGSDLQLIFDLFRGTVTVNP